MRSEGFPKRFCVRRWVEGPLEGMMDLSADAEAYKSRAEGILALGTGVAIAFLTVLAGILILDIWRVIFPFLSSAATFPQNLPLVLSIMVITVIFMALAFFSTLLLIQVWRYITVMLKRFENVEDLLGAPLTGPAAKAGKSAPESKKGLYLGPFNILGASSSFTKDIVRNMPQVCKQIDFVRNMMILMPLYYLALRFGFPLVFGGPFIPELGGILEVMFEVGLIILSVLSVFAGLLVWEAGRFMEALHAGLKLVDSVKNAPLPKVPEGATPMERLASYLEGKVGSCKPTPDGKTIRFSSDECLVMAIETATVPNLELVKQFTEACQKEQGNKRPARGMFIILYAPTGAAEDIGEDVEQHILANPLALGTGPGGGNAETAIQIMIEEEGTYGMFPFVG